MGVGRSVCGNPEKEVALPASVVVLYGSSPPPVSTAPSTPTRISPCA
jgi:hypothetical protein